MSTLRMKLDIEGHTVNPLINMVRKPKGEGSTYIQGAHRDLVNVGIGPFIRPYGDDLLSPLFFLPSCFDFLYFYFGELLVLSRVACRLALGMEMYRSLLVSLQRLPTASMTAVHHHTRKATPRKSSYALSAIELDPWISLPLWSRIACWSGISRV